MSQAVAERERTQDEVLWQHHDANIDTLLRSDPKFIVYLDHKLEVDWESLKAYQDELTAEKVDTGKIQGVITCLEAVPVDHLANSVIRSFRCILGEAMCLALEKDIKGAKDLLAKAEVFVTARNHEQARKWYVFGSSLGAICWLAVAGIVQWIYPLVYPHPQFSKLNILAVGMGGAAGALFSILLRVGHAPLDPSAGQWLHYLEGGARVTVGVIGALVLLCAVRTGLVLPQLTSPFGIVLICLIAGASERFASAIIERVEGSADHGTAKKEKINSK